MRGCKLHRRSSPPALGLGLVPLLVLLWAGPGGRADGGPWGFQGCKQQLNVSVLGALPGAGWDNLRNLELGLVLGRAYSQCLTTEDGEYLIPDGTLAVPRRETVVQTRADLMDSWVNYTDAWAASVNAEFSFLSFLNGKFSAECQNVRRHSLQYQTITTRVQRRHSIYSVRVRGTPDFHPDFRQRLLTLSDHLENNQTREAEYLAEMLVFAYGTHVLTEVEVGATLVQEDQVSRELVGNEDKDRLNVTFAASVLFDRKVGVGDAVSWDKESRLVQAYQRGTVASKIHSRGGPPFYEGLTLQKWQEGVANRLVAIGRSGLPLPALLQPEALPELPAPAVRRVEAAVSRAIGRYYEVNMHPGCVKRWAPNFDPLANVDDGSCTNGQHANFSFGGVFQECEAITGPEGGRLCKPYTILNPLTGRTSCPANYTASLLSSEVKVWSERSYQCWPQCQSCWLIFTCCHRMCGNLEIQRVVRVNASWCAPSGATPTAAPGLLFGGLYSPGRPNPRTGAQACPSSFFPLTLLGDLKVCVSSDWELGVAHAVPFGGFFSCQVGNPLAAQARGQGSEFLKEVFNLSVTVDHPMTCPAGYSQHPAYLSSGCQILYCLRAGFLLNPQQLMIRLPPFAARPSLLGNSSGLGVSVLVDASGQRAWVKLQGSSRWRQADIHDPSVAAQLRDQGGSQPSAGAVVGACLGAVLGVVALALGVTWGFRRYQKRGYRRLPEGILAEEQTVYGTAETAESPAPSDCSENASNSV
ncbi:macrophage-expressed gene 1 protein-like [Bos javanicus]|uniref:macrophage-expressed gene 1 protein-like n=1 Tax=Bos javanicus TaxID=9906 RepID=UPI002AA85CA6|nr:macrophage-expressed gene 1 protein-like [Bos javanicus]